MELNYGGRMGNLNYVFFEEYKHLDKLCGELYQDQHGISHYIDDMKNVSGNNSRYIPGWKEDLEKLIRLRHIRNYLAHTEGAFNEEICTQKDIEWSQEFHRHILNQSDPLAMLYRYSKAKQQTGKVTLPTSTPKLSPSLSYVNTDIEENKNSSLPTNKEKPSFYHIILLFIIVGVLLLVIWRITE